MAIVKVVCGIIFNNEKVFICRRKLGKSNAGYWEFPGGKIEKNETNQEALSRELFEELEMEVIVEDYIGVSYYDYGSFQIELYGYQCQIIKYNGKLTDHDSFEWICSNKLIDFKLAPADIPFIKMIRSFEK